MSSVFLGILLGLPAPGPADPDVDLVTGPIAPVWINSTTRL